MRVVGSDRNGSACTLEERLHRCSSVGSVPSRFSVYPSSAANAIHLRHELDRLIFGVQIRYKVVHHAALPATSPQHSGQIPYRFCIAESALSHAHNAPGERVNCKHLQFHGFFSAGPFTDSRRISRTSTWHRTIRFLCAPGATGCIHCLVVSRIEELEDQGYGKKKLA